MVGNSFYFTVLPQRLNKPMLWYLALCLPCSKCWVSIGYYINVIMRTLLFCFCLACPWYHHTCYFLVNDFICHFFTPFRHSYAFEISKSSWKNSTAFLPSDPHWGYFGCIFPLNFLGTFSLPFYFNLEHSWCTTHYSNPACLITWKLFLQ